MIIHRDGINYPMSVVSFTDDDAFKWVRDRVQIEKLSADNREEAWASVAQSIGVAPGTVENIDRKRRKSLSSLIRDKIHEHKIKCIRAEYLRLGHELAIADRGGSTASEDDLDQARAALKAAEAILQGARR